jgi:hypothetical protein
VFRNNEKEEEDVLLLTQAEDSVILEVSEGEGEE